MQIIFNFWNITDKNCVGHCIHALLHILQLIPTPIIQLLRPVSRALKSCQYYLPFQRDGNIQLTIPCCSSGGSGTHLQGEFTDQSTPSTSNMVIAQETTRAQWNTDQHKIPGPVFRVSPNELSFASVGSWKAIYGHASAGKQPIKSKFYDMYGSAYNSLCIGSERDPKKHSGMKRNLSAAFSTQALLEQEDVIQGSVDGFIEKIRSLPEARAKGLNMTHWFEMVSFDVLGEMAFGESFHAVQDGECQSSPMDKSSYKH